ncbi:Flagellar L-ring protein precursor [Maioricimonas rarisocia]|uniref:Flagellar L-ring protein n=1 Tax=Maioricimonas rarisocia TaxID=2528026 RepID=A0A517ZCP8_9PLAN|nr:flagellar basal body L-ring protein FlgH [Maioricimonas rarisocia]QDU40235.1 Flagellar L-ring protein precursor [Maioricimonas rarisocia]
MNRTTRLVVAATLLAVSGGELMAESIWKRRKPDHAFLFFDSKARRVGDLVTIVINQNTDVDRREDRAMEKSADTEGVFDLAAAIGGGLGSNSASAALDSTNSSGRSFDSGTAFRSNSAFTDRMTATVLDVLPNGNMLISGKRKVEVAGDEQILVVTGVVRAVDIGPDNEINSRYISDLTLNYEEFGNSRRFTRQGWFSRMVNVVWPF